MVSYRLIVGIILVAMGALLALGYNSYRTNLGSLQRLNEENIAWTSTRLESEYQKFLISLGALQTGAEGATPLAVNRRFDILWSRLSLAERGVVGERLRAYDDQAFVLVRLFDHMKREEQAVVGLSAQASAEIVRLHNAFATYGTDIGDFSRRVFLDEQSRVAAARTELRRNAVFIGSLNGMALAIGGFVLFFIDRSNRHNKKMATKNLHLADAAHSANLAKSRFLTMMSHELRTPMNGVLGMLSLAQKSGLTMPQMRMIEQAERSGRQMITMLSDILDYSALQDEEIVMTKKPFEPRNLAAAVEDLFNSEARREGIDFEVRVIADCPVSVKGDFNRLRQIVAHFASYIVEAAGTKRVTIEIGHAQSDLIIALEFEVNEGAAAQADGQVIDLLMGTRELDGEKFATDALGPSVSREMLARMGGSVVLDHSDQKVRLIIQTPADVHDTGNICAYISARSESLRTICKLALANKNFEIVDHIEQGPVSTVLLESGGNDELDRIKSIRAAVPDVQLIAIGQPENPSEFDDIMSLPLDVELLHRSLLSERSA